MNNKEKFGRQFQPFIVTHMEEEGWILTFGANKNYGGNFGFEGFFAVCGLGMDIGYALATQIEPVFRAKSALRGWAGRTS